MTKQLITPNPNIACTPGMCLVYVRETFGLGPKYPTASDAWKASLHKHKNARFPADVWVPIWFTVSDDVGGHVALRQPDGSVWSASSPTETQPVHHTSIEDLQTYHGGRLTYLGWTDDIEGVEILQATDKVKKPVRVILTQAVVHTKVDAMQKNARRILLRRATDPMNATLATPPVSMGHEESQ